MARAYGRAEGGRRAVGTVPHGRWERLTLLGGLSLDGLVASMTVKGATDTAVRVACAKHVLVPVRRPGQTVILDNQYVPCASTAPRACAGALSAPAVGCSARPPRLT